MKHPTGLELIAAECAKGGDFSPMPSDDADFPNGEMALAAACYALPHEVRSTRVFLPCADRLWRENELCSHLWSVGFHLWRPTPGDRITELVRAGAFIASEIERLQRQEAGK